MKKLKLGLAIASMGFLAACGGGGGGGGGGSETPKTGQEFRINEVQDVTVGENTTLAVSAQYSVKSIEPVTPNDNVTLTFSGNTINVSVADLQNPALGSYDVYMANGIDTMIQRYEVMGVNTSAFAYEDRAYDIRNNFEDLLNLAEDRKVYQFFVDLAYLKEAITPAQRDVRIVDFDARDSAGYVTAQNDMNALVSVFGQYLDGDVDESVLAGYVDQAESSLMIHGGYGLERLRAVEDLSSAVMSSLPDSPLTFAEDQGRFSRFFDSNMIEIDPDTGDVTYAAGYEILTPLTGI